MKNINMEYYQELGQLKGKRSLLKKLIKYCSE